jgi:hypothetical protein
MHGDFGAARVRSTGGGHSSSAVPRSRTRRVPRSAIYRPQRTMRTGVRIPNTRCTTTGVPPILDGCFPFEFRLCPHRGQILRNLPVLRCSPRSYHLLCPVGRSAAVFPLAHASSVAFPFAARSFPITSVASSCALSAARRSHISISDPCYGPFTFLPVRPKWPAACFEHAHARARCCIQPAPSSPRTRQRTGYELCYLEYTYLDLPSRLTYCFLLPRPLSYVGLMLLKESTSSTLISSYITVSCQARFEEGESKCKHPRAWRPSRQVAHAQTAK